MFDTDTEVIDQPIETITDFDAVTRPDLKIVDERTPGKSKRNSKSRSKPELNNYSPQYLLLHFDDKYEGTFQIIDDSDLIDAAVTAIKIPNNQLVKAQILNPKFDLGE